MCCCSRKMLRLNSADADRLPVVCRIARDAIPDRAEPGERGFRGQLKDLAVSVSNNPQQERRWTRVTKTYLRGKFEELIKDSRKDSREPPLAVFAQSDAYSRQVLDALNAFTAAEYEIRARRATDQRKVDQTVVVLAPLLSVLIAVVLAYWGSREIGLAGQQFAAALTKAAEASRAKDNFIATVSHEYKSPERIMLSSSILISDKELYENARQRVRAIDRAARIQA